MTVRHTPVRDRRVDLVLLATMPALTTLAARALAWMASFGETTSAHLPLATLVALGVLFGEPLAGAWRRAGRDRSVHVGAVVAVGMVGTVATLAIGAVEARDVTVTGAALVTASVLTRLSDRTALLAGAATTFTLATVLANYTLDAFLPVGPWFLVNVGTLFFGITFTQRDRLHGFGRAVVYRVIVLAAVANVVAALAVQTPLRYVAVSFLAILLAESVDTEVYQRLLRRPWMVRVASSNAVSVPVDTIVFTVLAFAGAPWATASWMVRVIVTDVVVKYASGLLVGWTLLRHRAWAPVDTNAR